MGKEAKMKIIAEIGASHDGDLTKALTTIKAAAYAGATGVKFQCWTPDTMDCGDRTIQSGPWAGWKLRDLYAKAHTPWEWFPVLINEVKKFRLDWSCSPFDLNALDYLESLECPSYKIASFEINDHRLINAVGQTCKPVVISTGMATPSEIEDAVALLYGTKCWRELILLHCVSSYPAEHKDFNLESMVGLLQIAPNMGLSDHSKTSIAAVVATTMGATMIERHIKLDDDEDGLDSKFASTPKEFAQMVEAVTQTKESLGSAGIVGPKPAEANSLSFRRSLWVVKDIKKGEPYSVYNVEARRPNEGMSPALLPSVLGKVAKKSIKAGTPLREI
jgi:sialic acid synthase SpsE